MRKQRQSISNILLFLPFLAYSFVQPNFSIIYSKKAWIKSKSSTSTDYSKNEVKKRPYEAFDSVLRSKRRNAILSMQKLSNVLNATTIGQVPSSESSSNGRSCLPLPIVLWRFTRPHTLIGSAIAIPSLHFLAASSWKDLMSVNFYASIVFALVPSLLMNIYITGLNQITDVEIDKINKPNLPIAAGDLSMPHAKLIVLFCLLTSLGMGAYSPSSSFCTQGLGIALWGSAILGTLYSLKPFRLKRFPALAAFCIVAVRGMIINTGFYAHAVSAATSQHASAGLLSCLTSHAKCFYSSLFFGIFGIVIALMKDVPDVRGDAFYKIKSLSVRLGPTIVFKSMKTLLALLFSVVSFSFFAISIQSHSVLLGVSRFLVAIASLLMGVSAMKQGAHVNAHDPKNVYDYYMHLWKLFYASYLILPFAR